MQRYRLARITSDCDFRKIYPLLKKQYLSYRSDMDDASFGHWLFAMVENRWPEFFLAFSDVSGELAGCAYVETMQMQNANCFINVLMTDTEGRNAVTIQMSEYLFRQYPLNKLFMLVDDDFAPPGFTCEGVLKEYRFKDGLYQDVTIWGFGRTDKKNVLSWNCNHGQ